MVFEPGTAAALSRFRFRTCARKAWNSSLQLVSACSQLTVADIDRLYRMEANGTDYSADLLPEEDFESVERLESHLAASAQSKSDSNVFNTVMSEIKESVHQHFHGRDEEGDVENSDQVCDPDLSLPDGKQLVKLTEVDVSKEKEADELPTNWSPPQTLTDALYLGLQYLALICIACFNLQTSGLTWPDNCSSTT